MTVTNPTDNSTPSEHPREIEAKVSYLPAARPFHHAYPPPTHVGVVREEAMAFFGVRDRQERDTYRYFLVIGGMRITNLEETLDQLADRHGDEQHELHFDLVEEITPGGTVD